MEQQAVALGRVKVMRNWLLPLWLCILYFCLLCFVFCILYFCILKVMEEELAALAELRMKEESATELSVGPFFYWTCPFIFIGLPT